MYLNTSVSLDESTAGLTPEQLDDIIESVQQQKKKLEDDIAKYIREKQNELRAFGQKLLAHSTTTSRSTDQAQIPSVINEIDTAPEQHMMESKHETQMSSSSSEEDLKVSSDTLVRQRDLELCGLITPSFLPLLDASSSRAPKKTQIPQPKRNDAAEIQSSALEKGRPKSTNTEIPSGGMTARETSGENSQKKNDEKDPKAKRVPIRKSSLRREVTPKPVVRRKRVSLVIDDQIVHPSDNIGEDALTDPPSETTTTTSASIEDLQEAIKRMVSIDKARVSPDNDEMFTDQSVSNISDEPTSPQATIDEFLEGDPVTLSPGEREAMYTHESAAPSSSYVGGYYGSGVDNVDQTGSYGYPSSQGASYMEKYMSERPWSVRKAAAEAEAKVIKEEEEAKKALEDDLVKELKVVRKDDVIDGRFLGEMEDI